MSVSEWVSLCCFSQEQNDEDDGAVNYENFGEPSTSVRLH